MVENLLLSVKIQEGNRGLNCLRVHEVAWQVGVQRAVADYRFFQRHFSVLLLRALGVERLLAVATHQEVVEVPCIVGASSERQVSSILEDGLGLGLAEGTLRFVHILDGLTALLAHLLHFIILFN